MTASNDFDPGLDQPMLFSARLTPHRSLNRTGFLVLMAFLSLVSFATGVCFWLDGRVAGVRLFGARCAGDLLGLPGQFPPRPSRHRGNFGDAVRTARAPGQPSRPCGRMGAQSALELQLDQKTHARVPASSGSILAAKGRRVSVGSFLGPDEKASFAKALLAALQAAKRGIRLLSIRAPRMFGNATGIPGPESGGWKLACALHLMP